MLSLGAAAGAATKTIQTSCPRPGSNAGNQLADYQPEDDRPAGDQPAGDHQANDQPAGDQRLLAILLSAANIAPNTNPH